MNNKKDFTPALGYNHLTSWYDKMIDWTMPEKEFRGKLIEYLSPLPGEKIMEFGFGTAQNLILSLKAENLAYYYGLDIDPKVENIAKEKLQKNRFLKNVQLELYDGNVFPFEDNFFDKVFSCLVFHQLKNEDKQFALMEIQRVLKPSGMLMICDWGKPINWFSSMGFYLVQILDGFKTTKDNRKGLIPDYLKSAGFQKVQQLGFVDTKIGTLRYSTGRKSFN